MTPHPASLRAALVSAFGGDVDRTEIRIVRAPGRVNLIGEHTDYNEGFVLPVAIDLETWLAFVPTRDRRVALVLPDERRVTLDLDDGPRTDSQPTDALIGLALSLVADGVDTRGLRGVAHSTIPRGSGLSSSAALLVAVGLAMSTPDVDAMRLARACRRAENEFAGVHSGLMDPFASTHGRRDAALLLDCRDETHEVVPLPLERWALVVCDSGVHRELAASAYNARRAECEAAVAALATRVPGVRSLRDVGAELLDAHAAALDAVALARARHVVNENARVLAAVDALRHAPSDRRLGELFAASHASLRDLYGVGAPELDALVEIATSVDGVMAARMTGAGFGGCTVNIVERGAEAALRAAVEERYPAMTGRIPRVYEVAPADRAGLLPQ